MSELRALLLTDVVDSTKLSEKIGDAAMAEVWSAHDRAARDLLPAWHGREIDKTDGMLLLFDTAADAVQYARAYHQALASLPVPLKARAGLHVGPVILRENPCCCETTAREAFVRDYRVFFVADATATINEELHLASLKNLAYGFAYVVDTKSICQSLLNIHHTIVPDKL